jgi:arylsulfatase
MPQEKRNTLDESLTLNIDLHPTILGAAGIKPPASVQGRNIADLYLEPEYSNQDTAQSTEWRKEFLYEFPIDNGLNMPMSSAVVRKDLKYIFWPQFKYEQLFNLTEDPLELSDLREDPNYEDIMNKLRERHEELLEAVK